MKVKMNGHTFYTVGTVAYVNGTRLQGIEAVDMWRLMSCYARVVPAVSVEKA